MKYIEARIFSSKQGLEPLASVVMAMGITNFAIDDPSEVAGLLNKKNQHDWDYVSSEVLAAGENEASITLYLDDTGEGRKALQKLRSAIVELKSGEAEGLYGQGVTFGRLEVEDRIVDDAAWKDNWKEYFKPFKATSRIVVKPTWEEYGGSSGELVIEMDPGMAFGTGTHPTTSMCMKFMERCAGQFKAVLDVGCGSGILSIAAALLGAEDVLGLDIDAEAVRVAKENVELNGFGGIVRIAEADLVKGVGFIADMAVANLIADLVLLLAEGIHGNLAPGGLFISSGILVEKLHETIAGIRAAGFEILDILEEDEWCAILARSRKNGA
ncbi:MAG: 50S ribosomal protein L11 methyltransferase [Clostridiales bacterium]|nr:50S ribosomal protein L11 methyltransferase [Clostridiales bacterium]